MAKLKLVKGKIVNFKLNHADANQVTLAGDFNNWDAASISLRKTKGNEWIREVTLKPGRYEYKFVVDGTWIADPNNSNRVCSPLGTENSVIEV